MNQAVETAIDALKVAIEAGEVEAGNKAIADYKASQPAPAEPVKDSGEPVQSGEPEPAATAQYSQADLDKAIAAQKQADQAQLEATTALLDASNAKIEALKGDVKELADDVQKAQKDAE